MGTLPGSRAVVRMKSESTRNGLGQRGNGGSERGSHWPEVTQRSEWQGHVQGDFLGQRAFLGVTGQGSGAVSSLTWLSLCCRLSSSCSKGHCSRLASSSSFFFLMIWFRLRCSRTRCSSGLLSTPRPLGRGRVGEPSGDPNSPPHLALPLRRVSRAILATQGVVYGTLIVPYTETGSEDPRSSDLVQVTDAKGPSKDLHPGLADCRDLGLCYFSLVSGHVSRVELLGQSPLRDFG